MSAPAVERLADVFVPSWISGVPHARLVRAGHRIRILVGIAALAFTGVIPASDAQRLTHLLLVGLVYLPWSAALLLASRRTEGPLLRLATLTGDVLVVFMFQTTIPPVHVAGMFGYLLITAYYATLGGIRAGLSVAGAALALTAAAQAITGQGVPGYILTMFGAVLASQVLLLDAVGKQQRLSGDRLRELDRLKDEFLASVSHELRTPLTSIDGFAQTLLRKWDLLSDPERREFVGLISRNAGELTLLIEQLLDFSRLEAGHLTLRPQPMDLAAAVSGCVEALTPTLGHSRVKLEIDEGLGVRADPNAMRRILSNLLLNAVKFSAPETPIVVGASRRGPQTVVWVRDEGVGIPAQDRGRVFDAFYQASLDGRQTPGTGVGLAIVRRYVEGQGGVVWVESDPGSGSTFSFTVPSTARRDQPSPAGSSSDR